MLERLEIKQLALIEQAVFEPAAGFTVITGETGAGKSLLLGAIQAVQGSKMSKEQIRAGARNASVEAYFSHGVAALSRQNRADFLAEETEDDDLILARSINTAGRNFCRLNGSLIPLHELQRLGEDLVTVHGQRDSQKIFEVAEHAPLLIKYAAGEWPEEYQEYQKAWQAWRKIVGQLNRVDLSDEERERMIDLFSYQINEIKSLDLKPGEEDALRQKKQKLSQLRGLITSLQQIALCLEGDGAEAAGAISLLEQAGGAAEKVSSLLEKAGLPLDNLSQAKELLLPLARGINKLAAQLDFHPDLLEEIEQRLDKIARLKKKYGKDEAAILDFAHQTEIKLDKLTRLEAALQKLTAAEDAAWNEVSVKGEIWQKCLAAAAAELSSSINRELADLGMQQAAFKVEFKQRAPRTATIYGLCEVEFLLQANLGEGYKPLYKIASGGEAARIMLAIKAVLAKVDSVPLLIFDEIDSGVSGETAARVGEKLLLLSRDAQVICVTHSAYIASMADKHYKIYKEVADGRTNTYLTELDQNGAKAEIARLLAGDTDRATAEKLASSLHGKAAEFKRVHGFKSAQPD